MKQEQKKSPVADAAAKPETTTAVIVATDAVLTKPDTRELFDWTQIQQGRPEKAVDDGMLKAVQGTLYDASQWLVKGKSRTREFLVAMLTGFITGAEAKELLTGRYSNAEVTAQIMDCANQYYLRSTTFCKSVNLPIPEGEKPRFAIKANPEKAIMEIVIPPKRNSGGGRKGKTTENDPTKVKPVERKDLEAAATNPGSKGKDGQPPIAQAFANVISNALKVLAAIPQNIRAESARMLVKALVTGGMLGMDDLRLIVDGTPTRGEGSKLPVVTYHAKKATAAEYVKANAKPGLKGSVVKVPNEEQNGKAPWSVEWTIDEPAVKQEQQQAAA